MPPSEDFSVEKDAKVHRRAEGERKEWDAEFFAGGEEAADVFAELAQGKSDDHRQQHGQKRGVGKTLAKDAEGDERKERAVIQRDDRNGADVAAVAVHPRQGEVQPAVAVRHGGDDGHQRKTEPAIVGIGRDREGVTAGG